MTYPWRHVDEETKRQNRELRAQRQRALYDLQIATQHGGPVAPVVPITAAKRHRRR